MEKLEEWVQNLIAMPLEVINSHYTETSPYAKGRVLRSKIVSDEIEALPSIQKRWGGWYDPELMRLNQVSATTLAQLQSKLRGQTYEGAIWDILLYYLPHGLPDAIVNDLIDRNIAISALGHTRQSDAIMYRLAPLVDEALLTLAGAFYENENYGLAEFRQLLRKYSHHGWMLQNLAYRTASSPEKEAAFLKVAQNPSNPHYTHLNELLNERRECKRAAIRDRERQQEADRRLQRAGELSISEAEIRGLYDRQEPEVLLALAHNPQTPLDVLEALTHFHGVPGAPAVRVAAKAALKKKANIRQSLSHR